MAKDNSGPVISFPQPVEFIPRGTIIITWELTGNIFISNCNAPVATEAERRTCIKMLADAIHKVNEYKAPMPDSVKKLH